MEHFENNLGKQESTGTVLTMDYIHFHILNYFNFFSRRITLYHSHICIFTLIETLQLYFRICRCSNFGPTIIFWALPRLQFFLDKFERSISNLLMVKVLVICISIAGLYFGSNGSFSHKILIRLVHLGLGYMKIMR